MRASSRHVLAFSPLAFLLAACASGPPEGPPAEWECGSRVELARVFEELVVRHDADGDGAITSEEYTRGEVRFANYDRNGDGVLTAVDFPADEHWNGFAPRMLAGMDANGDKVVETAELDVFIERVDADRNGMIEAAELGGFLPPRIAGKPKLIRLSFDQDLDGVLEEADLRQMFADCDRDGDGQLAGPELAGRQRTFARAPRPPAVGEEAPDFTLTYVDEPENEVRLSSFRGDRPVALVFGSYT